MKKLIFAASAALLLLGASCSKGSDTANGEVPKSLNDSISRCFGYTYGGYVLNDFQRFSGEHQNDAAYKENVLKGIQLAISNADDEATIIGMQIGGQLVNQLKAIEEQGVTIDRTLMLKELRKSFNADTVDFNLLQDNSAALNLLMEKAQQIKSAKDTKKDNDFIEQIKAENPNLQTSATGLSYIIEAQGEAPTATDTSTVVVNYVGKLVDGTVFDQSPEGQPATFGAGQVIPGFREGLKMLGKGGKATLYIPGNLAYGENGVPQAGIGPNAMLIFEVEVVDIK